VRIRSKFQEIKFARKRKAPLKVFRIEMGDGSEAEPAQPGV
jgi:hypothetical protein